MLLYWLLLGASILGLYLIACNNVLEIRRQETRIEYLLKKLEKEL